MRWNKQYSKNAVAKKAKLRIERANTEPRLEVGKVYVPRKIKPDFIIRIESARGERMQISVNRFFGRVRTSDGQSARQFCRGLEHLITKSA